MLAPKLAILPVAVTPFCQALPLYTFSSLEVVLKNKSPVSKLVVGLLAPTRYLSLKSLISLMLVATVLTFPIEPATVETLPATPATVLILFVGLICPATKFIFVVLAPAAEMLVAFAATVVTSVAFGTNL